MAERTPTATTTPLPPLSSPQPGVSASASASASGSASVSGRSAPHHQHSHARHSLQRHALVASDSHPSSSSNNSPHPGSYRYYSDGNDGNGAAVGSWAGGEDIEVDGTTDVEIEVDDSTVAPSEQDEYEYEYEESEALEREREQERERERERERQRERDREAYRHRTQSSTLEIDADDPYFLNHDTYRPMSVGSGGSSSTAWRTPGTMTPGGGDSSMGADRRIRPATRRNVSRACEQCRSRKSKCSGEAPCALCSRLGKECIYSTVADGRLTDRTAKRKIELLQDQVNALEKDLADALDRADSAVRRAAELEAHQRVIATGNGSVHNSSRHMRNGIGSGGSVMGSGDVYHTPGPASKRPYYPHRSRSSSYDQPYFELNTQDAELAPFGTGRFVLAPTGNLHLYPAATFYFPAHLAPDWQKALDPIAPGAPGSSSRPQRRGYLAPYLPFPLDPVHHAMLLDACFSHLFSFGRNSFRDKFEAEMEDDPMQRGSYFSPMLHLAILGIGWRYMTDERVARIYYSEAKVPHRGEEFIEKALQMVVEEVSDPRLSTVMGLITLSEFHTGMLKDPIGRSLYAMAMGLTQDLRLHRRCDMQLAELGMAVDSDLDIARRDVYGLALNLSAWYATYVGQDPLPLREHADQRLPFIRTDVRGPEREASEMFHYHVQLSDYGLQALHCNHTMRAPLHVRVARVKVIWDKILEWRESLPEALRWPPRDGVVLHPSVVNAHGMYSTYVIILFRPYILELGERSGIHDLALRACLSAAADIVAQSRYLSAVGSVTLAPLSWQHIIYVCGSMLVLQASGLPSLSEAERAAALSDLDYLQTCLDEIAHIWPIAGHTRMSLRQLLSAAAR